MPTPKVTFRKAIYGDQEFLYSLNETTMRAYVIQTWGTWDQLFQKEYFEQHFNPDRNTVILLEQVPIGMLSCKWEKSRCFLETIQILPDWQRKGIGTAIISDLLNKCQEQGIPLELQFLKANPILGFYEKLGFSRFKETETHIMMRAT